MIFTIWPPYHDCTPYQQQERIIRLSRTNHDPRLLQINYDPNAQKAGYAHAPSCPVQYSLSESQEQRIGGLEVVY